jgi:hypothetical protein
MGCSGSKQKQTVPLKHSTFRRSLNDGEKFNMSDYDGLVPGDSVDLLMYPPVSHRADYTTHRQQNANSDRANFISPVTKIDVSSNHRRIKKPTHIKPTHMKLDLNKLKPSGTQALKASYSEQALSSRSERVAEDFTVLPLQQVDPYDRFKDKQFNRRTADRPAAKTSRVLLPRTPVSHETPKNYNFTTFSDLMVEMNKRQNHNLLPSIKDALSSARKASESLAPITPRPSRLGALSKKSEKLYRIKGLPSSERRIAEASPESTSRRKSKAEMQWIWKGSYGKLKFSQ